MNLFELFKASTIVLGIILALAIGAVLVSGLIAYSKLLDLEDEE